ncbi:MAG: ATP-grasp domain-containing protein, partial [Leptospiraceae bacterium]|nr:ATP-grasp domain-containing protein [Leptospiraceae bacterium]
MSEKKIKKILIANRGEIAARVIQTCKKMGILSVAVYSDADRDSPFVKLADESVYIGESEARESYLNIPKIIDACKSTKADAVHPGYGFLSENPDFANSLIKENIEFIGPTIHAIQVMGDKIGSRIEMEKANVPVVPGYNGENQDSEHLLLKAKEIGFPVMIKASAGGGGKGMRRVENENEFFESLTSAKREALNFFKNDKVLLERYVKSPRHIEFQVFGDKHGNVEHIFERECSIQRRHQKVVEESPAEKLSESLRKKMGDVAVRAAKSIGYLGAGTVEFILGEGGEFYFLEMNTRLQVEHPVTEMVTGLDLVELQIRIAEGHPLYFSMDKEKSPKQKGHAIEVRIYAEDPQNNFLPSIGKIEKVVFPEGDGIRLDNGVEEGSEVSMFYDPMIAKLI